MGPGPDGTTEVAFVQKNLASGKVSSPLSIPAFDRGLGEWSFHGDVAPAQGSAVGPVPERKDPRGSAKPNLAARATAFSSTLCLERFRSCRGLESLADSHPWAFLGSMFEFEC